MAWSISPENLRVTGCCFITYCLNHCQPVFHVFPTHRIHGAGIYANIGGILMGSMLPQKKPYMDPMGYNNIIILNEAKPVINHPPKSQWDDGPNGPPGPQAILVFMGW